MKRMRTVADSDSATSESDVANSYNMAENFETVKISIFLNVTQIGLKTVFPN